MDAHKPFKLHKLFFLIFYLSALLLHLLNRLVDHWNCAISQVTKMDKLLFLCTRENEILELSFNIFVALWYFRGFPCDISKWFHVHSLSKQSKGDMYALHVCSLSRVWFFATPWSSIWDVPALIVSSSPLSQSSAYSPAQRHLAWPPSPKQLPVTLSYAPPPSYLAFYFLCVEFEFCIFYILSPVPWT